MGDGGRGTNRPAQARIVNYYENIRGIEVPYSRKMLEMNENGIEQEADSAEGTAADTTIWVSPR